MGTDEAAAPAGPGSAAYETCKAGLEGLAAALFLPASEHEHFATTYCDYGAKTGLYDENDSTWADLQPTLSQPSYLKLIDQVCVRFGNNFFSKFPDPVRKELSVEINSAEWGRRYCTAYFTGEYFSVNGTEESDVAQFAKDHLSLFTPVVVAGYMRYYQPALRMSRDQYRQVVEGAVNDAVKKGILTSLPESPFVTIDQPRMQALLLRALKKEYRNS
jgi:hypothetical protein